jgi:hypothetical protein
MCTKFKSRNQQEIYFIFTNAGANKLLCIVKLDTEAREAHVQQQRLIRACEVGKTN